MEDSDRDSSRLLSTRDANVSKTLLSPFVFLRTADGLHRFQAAAAGEDGEATEQSLLASPEEIVAPGYRVAQRLLPLGQVACSPRK